MRWASGVPARQTGEAPLYFKAPRKLWEFADGYQMSATVGTVMDRTKVPLTKWFWAAYLVATHTPGISAFQLAKQFGVRYETIYMYAAKAASRSGRSDRTPLSGLVEVDETLIALAGSAWCEVAARWVRPSWSAPSRWSITKTRRTAPRCAPVVSTYGSFPTPPGTH